MLSEPGVPEQQRYQIQPNINKNRSRTGQYDHFDDFICDFMSCRSAILPGVTLQAAARRGAGGGTPGTPRGATWRSRPAETAPPARRPGRAQTRRPPAAARLPPAAACCGARPPAAARTAAAAHCAAVPGCSSRPLHYGSIRTGVNNL